MKPEIKDYQMKNNIVFMTSIHDLMDRGHEDFERTIHFSRLSAWQHLNQIAVHEFSCEGNDESDVVLTPLDESMGNWDEEVNTYRGPYNFVITQMTVVP